MTEPEQSLLGRNQERLYNMENCILDIMRRMVRDIDKVIARAPEKHDADMQSEIDAPTLSKLFFFKAPEIDPYKEAVEVKSKYSYAYYICKDKGKREEQGRPLARQLIAKWAQSQMLLINELRDDPDEDIQKSVADVLDWAAKRLQFYQKYAGCYDEQCMPKNSMYFSTRFDRKLATEAIGNVALDFLPFMHEKIVRSLNKQAQPDCAPDNV